MEMFSATGAFGWEVWSAVTVHRSFESLLTHIQITSELVFLFLLSLSLLISLIIKICLLTDAFCMSDAGTLKPDSMQSHKSTLPDCNKVNDVVNKSSF